MYAAVKVLHSVLTSNAMCDRLMQHICGYQVIPSSLLSLGLPQKLTSPSSRDKLYVTSDIPSMEISGKGWPFKSLLGPEISRGESGDSQPERCCLS